MAESVDNATEPGSGDPFGAFNALLGYLGGQAATTIIFERLLWPQRYFSCFRPACVPKLAFLFSMAGPLSPTALEVIDTAFCHGLFNGVQQGHMLGSAFYQDMGWTYTMHALGDEPERESQIRNCLWVRAMLSLPLPTPDRRSEQSASGNVEKGHSIARIRGKNKLIRARVAVNHLTLTKATPEDISSSQLPFVSERVTNICLRSLLAICLTELAGIGVAVGVTVILRTLWAVLFVVPLVMHLISAILAVRREPLSDLPDSVNNEQYRDFEIQCPSLEEGFMLITGPPSVVVQFFRHYGHPVRDRFREIAQLVLIVAFGTFFPATLLCQVLWMPLTIQYIWTMWQVYIVIAMHFDRYTQRGTWSSNTESRIAQLLAQKTRTEHEDHCKENSILFGQERNGPGVVKATLVTTIVDSYKEGKHCMKNLIHRHSK
ncbi:hypothetical protein NCS52_01530000 [Fusarium sp. LHS14.1]|nr:hypothetical protein NCS52_01530000 [Fusarium sp. LHS14.1]